MKSICQLCGDEKCNCLAELRVEAGLDDPRHHLRNKLSADVARFVAQGGTIVEYPQGASGNEQMISNQGLQRRVSHTIEQERRRARAAAKVILS